MWVWEVGLMVSERHKGEDKNEAKGGEKAEKGSESARKMAELGAMALKLVEQKHWLCQLRVDERTQGRVKETTVVKTRFRGIMQFFFV